jgi:hypothetical protein
MVKRSQENAQKKEPKPTSGPPKSTAIKKERKGSRKSLSKHEGPSIAEREFYDERSAGLEGYLRRVKRLSKVLQSQEKEGNRETQQREEREWRLFLRREAL